MKKKLLLSAAAIVFANASHATVSDVTPTTSQGWAIGPFVSASFPGSAAPSGGFETGPATPPLGAGSYRASIDDPGSKVIALQNDFDGQLIKDLQTLSYSTYQNAGSTNGLTWYINLYIDLDANGAWDTRLDYQPAVSSTTSETWQTFNAVASGTADAAWGIGSNKLGIIDLSVADVFNDTDAVVLNEWDAGAYGALAMNLGDTASTYVGADFNLDNIVVEFSGANAVSSTYNLEVPEPSSLVLLGVASLGILQRRRRQD